MGFSRRNLDYPASLRFEVTNKCNANCVFCAYQYLSYTKAKEVMPMNLFEKALIQFIQMGGSHISLTPTVGEPLLDPFIFQRIKMAKGYKEITKIDINTNGLLLNKNNYVEALLSSGIDEVNISTAGFESKMFKRIYRTGCYLNLIQGIRLLLIKNQQMGERVRIVLELRPETDIFAVLNSPDFLTYIRPYISLKNVNWTYWYDNWGGSITAENLRGKMRLAQKFRRKNRPCKMTYHLIVKINGEIQVCGCQLNPQKPHELSVGNLYNQTLSEIWHGEKIKNLRASFADGLLPTVCQTCLGYRP